MENDYYIDICHNALGKWSGTEERDGNTLHFEVNISSVDYTVSAEFFILKNGFCTMKAKYYSPYFEKPKPEMYFIGLTQYCIESASSESLLLREISLDYANGVYIAPIILSRVN